MTRPDIQHAMDMVWRLVRSGPNFDGRDKDVEDAIAEAIDRAVSAERERCAQIVEDTVRMIDGADALAAIRGQKP